MKLLFYVSTVTMILMTTSNAQEAVYDAANHATAKEIKSSSDKVQEYTKSILEWSEKINKSLSGNRQSDVSGVFSSAGLGGDDV